MNRSASLAMPCWLVSIGAAFILMSNAEDKVVRKELGKAEIGGATSYRTTEIDGLSIFYREAGPKDGPPLLLLHGLPSSSRMFEPLFSRLSDRYHLIAPDYPGFGHSDWPHPKKFVYTFDHYRGDHESLHGSAGALALYAIHAGLRRAGRFSNRPGASRAGGSPHRTRRELRTTKASARTGNAPRVLGRSRGQRGGACAQICFRCTTTRTRHVGDDPNVYRYDPDLWTDEYAFLNQPGQAEIQSDLFYDYRTNVDAYPKWQAWMQNAAEASRDLGQTRSLVRSWRAGTLSQGRAKGGSARARRRTFRARYQSRRNRSPC